MEEGCHLILVERGVQTGVVGDLRALSKPILV